MYLHSCNIVHGDLKAVGTCLPILYTHIPHLLTKNAPLFIVQANVLVDDGENAVLCDFGLSRIKADITSRNLEANCGTITGSRNWMSPERLTGGRPRTPSDVYAFGLVIYEVCALDRST
jgi:serine/threonine protein kinase